jgi:hypothetical protein
MKPSESQWDREEDQSKLASKTGDSSHEISEEEQEYLDKKRPY